MLVLGQHILLLGQHTSLRATHTSGPQRSVAYLVKDLFLMLAHMSGTICLKHSATLILPPL